MSGPRGYSSYRGRKSKVKILLAVVLILVILAAVGFLILQKYVVYDESGTPHFLLPDQSAAESSVGTGASSSSGDHLQITIDSPKNTDTRAVQLTDLPLTDWTSAQAALAGSNANAAVVTLKDESGSVYYDSAAALGAGAIKADGGTAAAIAEMTGSDTYTIARIACFLDPLSAKADVEGMGLKNTGGYIFYDGNNQNWLDPGKPAARQYLVSLAKECAALGFDEILLTDVSYPTEGKLEKIDYGTGLKNENISAFLTEMRTALRDSGAKLSVELPAAVITSGSDTAAGLYLNELAPLTDRIYAAAEAADVSALTAAVRAENPDADFVPELAGTAPESGSCLLMP